LNAIILMVIGFVIVQRRRIFRFTV